MFRYMQRSIDKPMGPMVDYYTVTVVSIIGYCIVENVCEV